MSEAPKTGKQIQQLKKILDLNPQTAKSFYVANIGYIMQPLLICFLPCMTPFTTKLIPNFPDSTNGIRPHKSYEMTINKVMQAYGKSKYGNTFRDMEICPKVIIFIIFLVIWPLIFCCLLLAWCGSCVDQKKNLSYSPFLSQFLQDQKYQHFKKELEDIGIFTMPGMVKYSHSYYCLFVRDTQEIKFEVRGADFKLNDQGFEEVQLNAVEGGQEVKGELEGNEGQEGVIKIGEENQIDIDDI